MSANLPGWKLALGCLLLLSFAGEARADSLNALGYGPRAEAMGGAQAAEASDFTATFYNPALLGRAPEANFGAGVHWHRLVAEVRPRELTNPLDCTTCTPPDAVGLAFGLVMPLAGKVKNRLAIGLGFSVPTTVLLRLHAPDPDLPFWYRYQSNPERVVAFAGLGVRLADWLRVGLGLQALADFRGAGVDLRVDLFSRVVRRHSLNAYLGPKLSPVAGLSLLPKPWLRLGLTYRMEIKADYAVPGIVEFEDIGRVAFAISGVAHFTPHTVVGGVAWDLTERFTVSFDLEYMNWAAAPSPYATLTFDVSGETLGALGLDRAFDVRAESVRPGFSDTVTPRLGAEYRLSDRFAARLGVSWRPTPVPRQNARGTNLLDGSTLAAGAGFGFNFPDPLEILQHPVQMDVGLQGAILWPREALKEPGDPVPPYSYQGRLLGGTLAVRYDF